MQSPTFKRNSYKRRKVGLSRPSICTDKYLDTLSFLNNDRWEEVYDTMEDYIPGLRGRTGHSLRKCLGKYVVELCQPGGTERFFSLRVSVIEGEDAKICNCGLNNTYYFKHKSISDQIEGLYRRFAPNGCDMSDHDSYYNYTVVGGHNDGREDYKRSFDEKTKKGGILDKILVGFAKLIGDDNKYEEFDPEVYDVDEERKPEDLINVKDEFINLIAKKFYGDSYGFYGPFEAFGSIYCYPK